MSTDAPTVNDYDADTFAFGDCECDDPVPDPERLELPNGTVVQILACAECGDAIDWDVSGRPEDELRELVRDKQATIRNLRDTVVEQDERIDELEAAATETDADTTPIEERETNLIPTATGTADGQMSPRLYEMKISELQEKLAGLQRQLESVRADREELEDELAEIRNRPPLWRRAVSRVASRRVANLVIGIGFAGVVSVLTWPVANEAARTIERDFDTIGDPIVQLSPAVVGLVAILSVLIALAAQIGPRGVGR